MVGNRNGSITPIAVGLLTVAASAAFGTWGLLRSLRFHAETQFQLDHCVAREALSLKKTAQFAESSNKRMKIERAVAEAASALPPPSGPAALAAARAVLIAEEVVQDGIRTKWDIDRALWLTGAPCGKIGWGGMRRLEIPDWQRPPADELGPQPYEWSDPNPDFRVETHSGSLAAAATVECGSDSSDSPTGDLESANDLQWKARWAPARRI
jgi:hypothetical protein